MGFITPELDIVNGHTTNLWYDQSKIVSSNNTLKDLAISENIFLGDTEKDIMNDDDVLKEILQYLNLHIVQQGLDFYLYDWDSIRTKKEISWLNIEDNTTKSTVLTEVPITIDDYCSDGTNITISDVFNQIQLTCNIESLETVIESPLDDENLNSPYNNYQRFMSEINCEGNGTDAQNGFKDLMNNGTTTYDAGSITDWYVRVKQNTNWNFFYKGENLYDKLIERDNNGTCINQWKFPWFLKNNSYSACLLALGKSESKSSQDDTPQSNITLTDYLAISVNGNFDSSESGMDKITTDLQSTQPICVYNGTTSGIYSPIDSGTTNYLVVSGTMVLAPLMALSGTKGSDIIINHTLYDKSLNDYKTTKANLGSISKTWAVPYGTNDYGCYYMHKFWEQKYPIKDYNIYNESNYKTMIYPFISIQNNDEFEYNYSADGNGTDKINKIPVIECELKIGNKYCVEEYVETDGILNSVYHWYTLDNCPTYTDDDGSVKKKTTFSLGFNPKIGDHILGKEYDIQKNFDNTYNIDTDKGTAIPISYNDALVGVISFKILGPVNSTWNEITRRHPTWFRHTQWSDSIYSILSHTSTIFIKNFEAKIYSDNAGFNDEDDDNDLVYCSDETDKYIKKKDDITFKLNTALTSAEAIAAGVKNTINLSSVIRTSDNFALTSLTNQIFGDIAKPEELYCDAYYREYNQPKILLQTDLHDTSKISPFRRYTIGYMGKTFYPIKIDSNIINGSVNITLKEL